ncbi:MAG: TerB family tellurite resistance protein [Myxococcales bacterium]|nr:TerB family tellurite resistance protein [Myxococcales bacterium]
MLRTLDKEDRLQLMKFVCSFAWADLEVKDSERAFVGRLVRRLELGPEEKALVESWLEVPPPPEEVDPMDIPRGHRELFIQAVRAMIVADGQVDDAEAENFELLSQLLADR